MTLAAGAQAKGKTAVAVLLFRVKGGEAGLEQRLTSSVRALAGTARNVVLVDVSSTDEKARDAYGDDLAVDAEALFRLVKGFEVEKVVAGTVLTDTAGHRVTVWIFDAEREAQEYETRETAPPGSDPGEAVAMAAGRILLKLEGNLPVITSMEAGDGSSVEHVPVTWQCSPQAEKYRLYRSMSMDGDYTEIGSTEGLSFNDADAIPGVRYWYEVRGLVGETRGDPGRRDAGYRKIAPPQGLNLEAVIGERTGKTPGNGEKSGNKQEQGEEARLRRYYINPAQLNLVMFVSNSYIKSGKIVILREFEAYTLNEETREVSFKDDRSPYVINFKSKKLFRIRREVGDGLFSRLMKNSLLYCVYTGDRETIVDGTISYMVPSFEAAGLSTGYYVNDRDWREKTIMLSTDNKELREQMEKVGEPDR